MNARLSFLALAAAALLVSWCASFALYRAAERGDEIMPLEERDLGAFGVVAVGTGSAYENPTRGGPGIAVGTGTAVALVDAGRGVAEGLRRAGFPVAQPTRIYLTSLLAENTSGIDDLLATSFRQGRSAPLELVGPPGTAELAQHLTSAGERSARALAEALALDPNGARIAAIEVSPGAPFEEEWNGLRVRAGAIDGGPIEALAWSFERAGERVVVSSAGWNDEALVAFAQGASLLVHEAVYVPTAEDATNAQIELDIAALDRERPLHTSINDVGALAARARVGALALVRLRPPPLYDFRFSAIAGRSFDGRVLIPEDGDDLWP